MTKTNRYHLVSPLLILPLLLLCCHAPKKNTAQKAFKYGIDPLTFKDSPSTNRPNFVVMNDGSVVNGTKVTGWIDNGALLNKKVVRIDGREIPVPQVSAYQTKEGYFIRIGKDTILHKIMAGRLTVYHAIFSQGGHSYSITFFQKNNGPIKAIYGTQSGLAEVKQLVSDCKKAYDMISIPIDDYMRIIWTNPYYTQTIIETYNNCGEWK
jgi:hypothetical protein